MARRNRASAGSPTRQDRGVAGNEPRRSAPRHAGRARNTVTANWLEAGSIGLRRCIEAVVEGSGFRERWGEFPEGRGLGLACGSYLCGAGLPIYWNHMPQSGVQLKLDRSGGVAVFCSKTKIGQGSDSVLAVIVAEVLGLALADVRLCVADTDLTPVDLGSYSSRVTLMMGNAARDAAEKARAQIAAAVSRQLDIPLERLVFAEGRRVRRRGSRITGRSWTQLCGRGDGHRGALRHPGDHRVLHPAALSRALSRRRGGAIARLLLLGGRGRGRSRPGNRTVAPQQVWMAHDVGKCIRPDLVMGQIEGSVYMGLGEAMMEESAFRRLPKRLSNALVHKFPSMLEYKSLTFEEMPPVTSYIIEDPDPNGPSAPRGSAKAHCCR